MKLTHVSPLAFVLVALAASPSLTHAASPMLDGEGNPLPIQTQMGAAGLTHAQVMADYFQARRDGTLPTVDAEGTVRPAFTVMGPPLTREQVRQELREDRRLHGIPIDSQG